MEQVFHNVFSGHIEVTDLGIVRADQVQELGENQVQGLQGSTRCRRRRGVPSVEAVGEPRCNGCRGALAFENQKGLAAGGH